MEKIFKFKTDSKMLTFQLIFSQEAYPMDLVLLSLERGMHMSFQSIKVLLISLTY